MTKTRVFFTLQYNDQKGENGNRWQNSKTDLILTPHWAKVKGDWDTRRPSDIDSAGGSSHAIYHWDRVHNILHLMTAGYESVTMTEVLVTLYSVNDFKLGAKGTGVFYFRQKALPITWQLELMEISKDDE